MMHTLIPLAAFALLLPGSTDEQRSDPVPSQKSILPRAAVSVRKPLDGDLKIEIENTVLPDRRVVIRGTTNLPAGTDLGIDFREKATGGFHGQSSASVRDDGSFESEPFGASSGLPDGLYVVGVTVPYVHVQPEHARKLLGPKGENMKGPLVEKDRTGATAHADREFIIGGEKAAKTQGDRTNARLKRFRELRKQIVALNDQLRIAKKWLDNESKPGNLGKWGLFARQYRKDYRRLADEFETFDVSVGVLFADTIGCLNRVFDSVLTKRPSELEKASNDFRSSLKTLDERVLGTSPSTPLGARGKI